MSDVRGTPSAAPVISQCVPTDFVLSQTSKLSDPMPE